MVHERLGLMYARLLLMAVVLEYFFVCMVLYDSDSSNDNDHDQNIIFACLMYAKWSDVYMV